MGVVDRLKEKFGSDKTQESTPHIQRVAYLSCLQRNPLDSWIISIPAAMILLGVLLIIQVYTRMQNTRSVFGTPVLSTLNIAIILLFNSLKNSAYR
jgi:hypothetical protein